MERRRLQEYKLPDSPGIYIFKKGRKILYIGKATSLRDRVRSYFSTDLVRGRGERVVHMVEEAKSVSHVETSSVLEALILEANLIKKHQPPYNVDQKDDKSWNYVVITKEEFPRVLVVRGRELYQNWDAKDVGQTFGPFPHGTQLQQAMKLVRRVFPYRDKCIPNSRKSCFNRQIGLCPGVCSGEITKEAYAERIKHICTFLSGNFKGLKRQLATKMKAAAKTEKFEEATELRRQIHALEHIRDVSLIKDEHRVAPGGSVRIEAFDVAHTAGTEAVGVMMVVSGGEPQRAAYRKFIIRTVKNDDVEALKEILSRRLNHPEWPLPRVFVVDGGSGQVRAAQAVLKKAGIEVPIVGVVKNQFHKPERLIGEKRVIEANEKDILLANAEAHRFAIQYHRKRLRFR